MNDHFFPLNQDKLRFYAGRWAREMPGGCLKITLFGYSSKFARITGKTVATKYAVVVEVGGETPPAPRKDGLPGEPTVYDFLECYQTIREYRWLFDAGFKDVYLTPPDHEYKDDWIFLTRGMAEGDRSVMLDEPFWALFPAISEIKASAGKSKKWYSGHDLVKEWGITIFELFEFMKRGLQAYTGNHKLVLNSDLTAGAKKRLLLELREEVRQECAELHTIPLSENQKEEMAEYRYEAATQGIFDQSGQKYELTSFDGLLNESLSKVWNFKFRSNDLAEFLNHLERQEIPSYDELKKDKEHQASLMMRDWWSVPEKIKNLTDLELQERESKAIHDRTSNDIRMFKQRSKGMDDEDFHVGNSDLDAFLDTDNELPNIFAPERTSAEGKEKNHALNFFHKEGDIWHIGFGGKETRIKHFSGLQYIAYLLEKPGTSISYNKLNQITSRATNALSVGAAINEGLNVGRSSQAAADNEARTAYIKKYKQLGVDLDNTEDTPEGAMLREEIEKDMASLQSAISERALPDKETKNLQSNIQKNIKRAYDAIEETELKDLVAYLQTHIQPGGSYDLSYTGVAVWEIIL